VSQMLLGSVSHHCAIHAHCPLVIIHSPPSDGPPAAS
jgi:nucleotide-binding universal stress UspA family protein